MSAFTPGSWRRSALVAAIALLTACGNNQSSAPSAAAGSDQQASTQPQNATVAELLSGSDTTQPSAVQPSAAQPSTAQPSTAASGSTRVDSAPAGDSVSVAAPEPGGDQEYARVVSVSPVTGPHRVCTDETVTEQRKPEDQHQVAGTLIGAIAGGVIGHQIGGGRGRTLATVGGAVGGGVVGKQIQKNQQSRDTVTRVVKHCRMVDGSAANAPVYDVVYAYQGQNFHVRLDHDPGDRIALPVRGIDE